ncbi:MAG: hypothetical protein ACE5DM_01690 [Candidatus Nanoarchaeia archaeon]
MIGHKGYHALRHNKNFSKLSAEFLIFAVLTNVQYVFLVLESLKLLGFGSFDVRVKYIPAMSVMGEWNLFVSHGYNLLWLYYHFIEIFFTVTKNMTVYLYETVRHNPVPGLILCFLIVTIWLAYSGMSYGYSKRESKKHNVFWHEAKTVLFRSNLLERSLWMIFFVELLAFVLTPQSMNIIFLIVVWALLLSLKFTSSLSNFVVDLTARIEKSILYNKWTVMAVTIIDFVLVYFDSSRLFALLIMILAYCAIAQLVFIIVKDSRQLLKTTKWIFNLGVLIFFFGIVLVYYLAFLITNIFLLPFWLYYLVMKRRALPSVFLEATHSVILVGLLVYYFI